MAVAWEVTSDCTNTSQTLACLSCADIPLVKPKDEGWEHAPLQWGYGKSVEPGACNPGYSGGRDQEDRGAKPAQANSLWDPNLKNPSQK
jgi:hypothetical protein